MGLLRDHRRKKILEEQFPAEWEDVLVRRMAHWSYLDDDERARLRDLLQVFVAEKHWEGCHDFDLTDDVKVTIAGEACLLLLGLDGIEYDNVREVLVYPTTVITPNAPHAQYGPIVESGSEPIIGEAAYGGPVLLVWDAVTETARHPERGENVVYHEFAHKLDMLSGQMNGTPPLASRYQLDRWVEVCTAEFEHVQQCAQRRERTFLDPYAGRNVAEFFAVGTEAFFDRPVQMKHRRPRLYKVLSDFFNQDPATRMRHRT